MLALLQLLVLIVLLLSSPNSALDELPQRRSHWTSRNKHEIPNARRVAVRGGSKHNHAQTNPEHQMHFRTVAKARLSRLLHAKREFRAAFSSSLEKCLLRATRPDALPVPEAQLQKLLLATKKLETVSDLHDADPYAVICSKLWKKLGERDWRTIAKALYTLHRLLRSKTGSSSSCSSASSSGAVTTDVAPTTTASAASRVFASAFTAHLQARAAKADSLAEQIQLRAGIQASWLKAYADYMAVRASSYSSALDSLASLGCIASHSQVLEIVSKLNILLSSGLASCSATDVAGAPPLQTQCCELVLADLHELVAAVRTSSAPLLTAVEQPLQEQCAQLCAHTAAVISATTPATSTGATTTATASAAADATAVTADATTAGSSCPEWLQAMTQGVVQGQTAVVTDKSDAPVADVAATSSTSSSSDNGNTAHDSNDVAVATAAAVDNKHTGAAAQSDRSELVRAHRSHADVSSDVMIDSSDNDSSDDRTDSEANTESDSSDTSDSSSEAAADDTGSETSSDTSNETYSSSSSSSSSSSDDSSDKSSETLQRKLQSKLAGLLHAREVVEQYAVTTVKGIAARKGWAPTAADSSNTTDTLNSGVSSSGTTAAATSSSSAATVAAAARAQPVGAAQTATSTGSAAAVSGDAVDCI
eukprot:20087-Heterococcus_DN1.PRE.3